MGNFIRYYDDLVLVSAAAGGVGHLAVQLASVLGACVAATASTRDQVPQLPVVLDHAEVLVAEDAALLEIGPALVHVQVAAADSIFGSGTSSIATWRGPR